MIAAQSPRRRRQRGLTMVELLVAMTIGLVVTIAAISTLIMGRTGFSTVDNTGQLVDRERFAVDLLSRIVMQAGYEDFSAVPLTTRAIAKATGVDPEPDIYGWNNALYAQMADLNITTSTLNADGNRSTGCSPITDTSCLNGSDILLVRFQGSSSPTTGAADGTMTDCRGQAEPAITGGNLNRRAVNILYVARDANGEPSLYCAYYDLTTNAWVAGTSLIEGVESLQVLYGTDNVTPATAPPAAYGDTIVDRWLRADELKVTGNTAATRDNWRRVRAVRIGMVLRGPKGSAQTPLAATLNPLGPAYVNASDTGSALAVTADSRLRRVATFTVHLRNDLSLE